MPDALGLQLAPVNATGPDDLEQAFAALMEEQVQACVLLANTVLFNNRLSIAEMALANRLPGISDAVEFVEAGFLLVYGVQIRDLVASLPFTSTRSSREKPGELAVEQPTKFVLSINLNTANALGPKIQPELLASADEVIE